MDGNVSRHLVLSSWILRRFNSEEALARCYADLSAAYELLTPLRAGETEEQALARLDPELATVARRFDALARESARRMNSFSHLSEADMRRLVEISQMQSEDWRLALEEAGSEAESSAIYEELTDQAEVCIGRFFPNG